ncbi:hypothetical protein CFC21_070683 [Triticum aestivum]|uniref:Uncharacterized protein n=2 Tax=Triticum aestivum TaxID=4565 RepID=A0A3B6LIM3_WHEAT|nr:hypothetical protein CFC21_070683 [Triticum aestivum]
MIPAPSARLRRCRQSTGVGASCPATNKNRRYMTYEATRGYYTSRLLTACNLLASNMIVTHSKEVRDGNTCFKCSPLIRDAANKENLWEALLVMQSPIHPSSNLLLLINCLHVIEK